MSSVHQNSFVKKEAEKRLEEQEALKLLVKVRYFQLKLMMHKTLIDFNNGKRK